MAAALLLAALAPLAGCVHDPNVLVIGSKAFSEGAILGYVELLALQHAGYRVEDRIEMGPTLIVRQALLSDEIDTYVEYTGTALVNFFHLSDTALLADPRRSYQAVERLDSHNGLRWLEPWSLNDTYAVLMSQKRARKLGIRTVTDLARYPGRLTFGADPEFVARADGLPGLEGRYHLEADVKQLDAGLIYPALRDGMLDAAIGYSTDGRISAFHLVRLEDDRQFFPSYHPAPVFRADVVARQPRIAATLDRIGPLMTDDEITRLNYQMDVEHKRAKTLAANWLAARHLI